jgi:hypothetical protein
MPSIPCRQSQTWPIVTLGMQERTGPGEGWGGAGPDGLPVHALLSCHYYSFLEDDGSEGIFYYQVQACKALLVLSFAPNPPTPTTPTPAAAACRFWQRGWLLWWFLSTWSSS